MVEGFVLVVDDQPVAAEDSIAALTHYLSRKQILYTKDPAYARKLMETRTLSLVFLDIDMPETSGFALAAYMEEQHKGLPYVFLTGYADFAAESYDYEPVDFLTKPVDVARLGRTFARLNQKKTMENAGRVAVRAGKDYMMIDPRDIHQIYKERRKVWIRLKDGSVYQVSATMDELERIFSDYGLFRCHQSFLIPIHGIQKVGASSFGQTYEAVLDSGMTVPVSRGKYAKLKEELEALGIPFVKSVIDREK